MSAAAHLPETPARDRMPARGSLAEHGPEAVLTECARVHFTGTLAFQAGELRGVLPMLKGAPELGPEDAHLERALEEFLGLREGRFTLTAMLPELEGARAEGDLERAGELDKLSVPELFRYCEQVGMTGTLTMHHAHAACVARFRHGELLSLTVDDEADEGFTQVFSWTRGTFVLTAKSPLEEDAEAHAEGNVPGAAALLKTLEVGLAEILSKREAAQGGVVLSLRPPSMQRSATLPYGLSGARPATSPPPGGAGTTGSWKALVADSPPVDSTVKIFLVNHAGAPSKETQHASVGGVEVLPLGGQSTGQVAVVPEPIAVPPPKPAPEPESPPAPAVVKKEPAPEAALAKPEARRGLDPLSLGVGAVLAVLLGVGVWALLRLLG